jgi:hypothetical protein
MASTASAPHAEASHSGRRFAAFHKADRNFFLLFVAVCWFGVVMGFTPPAVKRWSGNADYPAPLLLQVHALAFTGWLVLLTTQVGLVRTKRMAVHMTLGLAAVALIPVMAVTAFLSEVYSQRFYLDHPPDSQAFFILPIFYVIAFTVLAASAVLLRKDPSAHKRFILLATTVIVGAAYTRWIGAPLTKLVGDGYLGLLINSFTATNLILLWAAVHDLRTRGQLHWSYKVAIPAILASEVVTTLVYHSPGWLPIARVIVGR